MKLKHLIILLIAIALVTIGITMIYYSFFRVIDVQETQYLFTVDEYLGLNTNTDLVNFGTVPPGNKGMRWLNLKNDFNFPVKVRFSVKGEKSKWIAPEENNFVIEPNITKEVKIAVYVPDTAEKHENYTGTITTYYTRS